MSAVTFRSPKASVSCPLGSVSSDEIEIKAAINSHTTASFTAYSGKEAASAANQVFSDEAAKLMGKAQALGFSPRTSPDTTINLEDGQNKKLTVKMFLTGPTFMMNGQTLRPAFSAVSESALLNNLKLDVYTTFTGRKDAGRSVLSAGELTISTEAKSTNLATRLSELTDLMISYWKNNANNGKTTSAELKRQRDLINQKGPLPMWKKLLSNSTKSLAGTSTWLKVIASERYTSSKQFNQEQLALLRGTTRDFQEVLDALCSAFQMVMIPSIDGGVGRLALMDELLTAAPKTLMLPASSMLLNGDVSQDLLPVQQVLARGLGSNIVLSTLSPYSREADEGGNYIGGFPATAPGASGDIAIVPLPSYLSTYVSRVKDAQGTKPPNKDGYGSSYSKVKNLTDEFVSQLAEKAVNNYCRSVYIDMALGGSSTSISLPADTTLWPGTRYRVVNTDSKELFTGFLAGVTHSFKKAAGGGGGQAFSTCNFTHILFPGFKLPGV